MAGHPQGFCVKWRKYSRDHGAAQASRCVSPFVLPAVMGGCGYCGGVGTPVPNGTRCWRPRPWPRLGLPRPGAGQGQASQPRRTPHDRRGGHAGERRNSCSRLVQTSCGGGFRRGPRTRCGTRYSPNLRTFCPTRRGPDTCLSALVSCGRMRSATAGSRGKSLAIRAPRFRSTRFLSGQLPALSLGFRAIRPREQARLKPVRSDDKGLA